MKKPRILIVMHYLEIGGAETSLIGLLDALDPNLVDIDLFLHAHRGELMSMIPEYVNLLPEIPSFASIEISIIQALKRKQFGIVMGRIFAKIKHRFYRLIHPVRNGEDGSIFDYVADSVLPFLPPINPDVEYDLCISYLQPHQFAFRRAQAKKYVAWIHTDYSFVSLNISRELRPWMYADYIVAISDKVRENFCNLFPTLSSKVIDVENILSEDFIRLRAKESPVVHLTSERKIISIGRFVHAKNFELIPWIILELKKIYNHDFHWYIIGYGDDRKIRNAISETNTDDVITILGKKSNPYPYVAAADVYVQPSRYEGKSITVREAQILGKPVVITPYPTAESQIKNGIDGVIAESYNPADIAKAIKWVLESGFVPDYANPTDEVRKIYALIG